MRGKGDVARGERSKSFSLRRVSTTRVSEWVGRGTQPSANAGGTDMQPEGCTLNACSERARFRNHFTMVPVLLQRVLVKKSIRKFPFVGALSSNDQYTNIARPITRSRGTKPQ